MRPFVTEQVGLRCHAALGYRVGGGATPTTGGGARVAVERQLVNVLVRQLGASLRLERSGGSRFEVVIPSSG